MVSSSSSSSKYSRYSSSSFGGVLLLFLLLCVCCVGFFVSETQASSHDLDAKVIIIGSGFGGSISAYRLGKKGVKTLILEKGRRWDIKDPTKDATFATFRKPDGRASWFRSITVAPGASPYFGFGPIEVTTGVLQLIESEVNDLDPGVRIRSLGQNVNVGVGVGGGSLVYNGAMLQPTKTLFQQIFDDPIYDGLYKELDSVWFPKAAKILKPAVIPDSVLNTPYYRQSREFYRQAVKAGFHPGNRTHGITKLAITVDWKVVEDEIRGKKVPAAINGEVWFGINSGAKYSLDRPGNYLHEAEKFSSVTVKHLHDVTEITYDESSKIWELSVLQLDQDSGRVVKTKTFRSKFLIIAAGSVETTSLLVRAKAKGQLPNLNDEVGKHWGNNGDNFGLRSDIKKDGVVYTNPTQGGPASYAIHDETNPVSPSVLMSVPVLWAAPVPNALTQLGMGIPQYREGTFTYDSLDDSVTLDYTTSSGSPVDNVLEGTSYTYDTLNKANSPSIGSLNPIIPVCCGTSAHPLGGVLLGKATDMSCRVSGYSTLYVTDGSLIHGSTGCTNPAFTIAALAERCVDRFMDDIVS